MLVWRKFFGDVLALEFACDDLSIAEAILLLKIVIAKEVMPGDVHVELSALPNIDKQHPVKCCTNGMQD